MELFAAIEKRRSYRGPYLDRPVPGDDLRRIVAAGIAAPSGTNAQTTAFVIVDDQKLVRKIGAMHANCLAMQQARAFIACFLDRRPETMFGPIHFEVEDVSAAVENMLLAITGLGYASVWVDGWLRAEGRAVVIGGLLGAPADKVLRIILPVGVPAEDAPPVEKRPFNERAWMNRYGAK
jgi:nitroreductase